MTAAPSPTVIRHRGLQRQVLLSVAGSVLPAVVGAAGTIVAAQSSNSAQLATLLVAWSVAGYLALTDLGLTRSASRLVAERAEDAAAALRPLRRVSVGAATLLSFMLMIALVSVGAPDVLLLLALLPWTSALQFPVVGALEALGRFGLLAAHRLGTATCTFLLPGVLVAASDAGLVPAVVTMVGYRCLATVALSMTIPTLAGTSKKVDAAERREAHLLVFWVAISSVLGPAMLYADRAVLTLAGATTDAWNFYVTLSEVLLKTYMLPAAVVAAVFPWLVRNLGRASGSIRTIVGGWLPLATASLIAAATAAIWMGAGDPLLVALGMRSEDAETGRLWASLLVGATLASWLSQVSIALLHAADGQRDVAKLQMWLVLPYAVALVAAALVGSVAAVAAVWAGRIVLMSIGLNVLARKRTGTR